MSRNTTKPIKWPVCPVKIQISLGICPIWSESSLCAQWVAKDPRFLHADSEDSDQTGRMPRLIWVFARRTCHFTAVPQYKEQSSHKLWGKTSATMLLRKTPFKRWPLFTCLICTAHEIIVLIAQATERKSHRRPVKAHASLHICAVSQRLCCSHTWSMEVDKGSHQKLEIKPHRMAAHAHLKNVYGGGKEP